MKKPTSNHLFVDIAEEHDTFFYNEPITGFVHSITNDICFFSASYFTAPPYVPSYLTPVKPSLVYLQNIHVFGFGGGSRNREIVIFLKCVVFFV